MYTHFLILWAARGQENGAKSAREQGALGLKNKGVGSMEAEKQ